MPGVGLLRWGHSLLIGLCVGRMYQQRFTTAAIIAVLVLLILVVLYSKFRG